MRATTQIDWQRKSRRGKWQRIGFMSTILAFLTLISLPIAIAYLWLVVISFTSKSGGTDFEVLGRVLAILALVYLALLTMIFCLRDAIQLKWLKRALLIMMLLLFAVLVVPKLTIENYRFLWDPDVQATGANGSSLPSIWSSLGNSLLFAIGQTLLVTAIAVPAAYALSRFGFRRREGMLRALMLLQAFPVLALTVALFIQLYWMGMLNSIYGVILVMCALEMPFAIFVMKNFFDGVSWDIEMSAITDGATRFQAFRMVILPQVTGGIIAIATFAFLRGWEEYVFVRTLLIDNTKMTMSLYLFWASQDSMGSDPGLIAAVGMVYILPVVVLYVFTQKYLTQMSVGGIKG